MVSPGPLVDGARRARHRLLRLPRALARRGGRAVHRVPCPCRHRPEHDQGRRHRPGSSTTAAALKASFHQELIEQDCMACHSDHRSPHGSRSSSRKPFSHAVRCAPAVRAAVRELPQTPADRLHRTDPGQLPVLPPDRGLEAGDLRPRQVLRARPRPRGPCETCHKNNDYSRYTCYGCHEHSQAKIRAEHVEEGIRDFENCVECHRDPGVSRRKAREQAKRAGARRTDRAGRPGLVVRGWGWLWANGLVTSVVTGPRTRGQWQDYPSAIGTEWPADGNRWSMHGCAVGFRRRRGMPISGIRRPGTPSPIGSNSIACSASVGRLHRCRPRVPDSRTDLAPRPHRAGRWCKALARWMNTSDSTEAAYRVEPDAWCRNSPALDVRVGRKPRFPQVADSRPWSCQPRTRTAGNGRRCELTQPATFGHWATALRSGRSPRCCKVLRWHPTAVLQRTPDNRARADG